MVVLENILTLWNIADREHSNTMDGRRPQPREAVGVRQEGIVFLAFMQRSEEAMNRH
jgi:hypothetical protein